MNWLEWIIRILSLVTLGAVLWRWGHLAGYRKATRDCGDVMQAQSRAIASLHGVIEDMVKVQSAPPGERQQAVLDVLERRMQKFTDITEP